MANNPRPAVQLGAFDIGCVVVGGIIGVGIFFTPARVAAVVDEPEQMIVAWSLGGVLAILGALVFAALSRAVPGHGGTFVYIYRAFGALPAFLYGWANWLVIQAGALGVIGLVMVSYLDKLLWGADVTPMPTKVAIAGIAIVAFTLLNALGLRVGKRVQNTLTVAKVIAVFSLVVLALLTTGGAPPEPAEPSGAPVGWPAALAAAMLPVLFSFGGWQQGSFVAGAARRPTRDVPIGIIGGVLVVTVAYITVNLAFLDVLGLEGAARSETIAEDAARRALADFGVGEIAGRMLSAFVVLSSLGILNTICLAPPFVLHAMAERGLFLAAAGRIHANTGAPVIGVLVQGFWGAALLVGTWLAMGDESGATLDTLLNGVVFVDWLFFGACGIALWRIIGPTLVGAVFAVGGFAVMIGAVDQHPVPSAAGLAVCALGVPVFVWMRVRARRGGQVL